MIGLDILSHWIISSTSSYRPQKHHVVVPIGSIDVPNPSLLSVFLPMISYCLVNHFHITSGRITCIHVYKVQILLAMLLKNVLSGFIRSINIPFIVRTAKRAKVCLACYHLG